MLNHAYMSDYTHLSFTLTDGNERRVFQRELDG
jgi:hypothetical protein